MANTTNFGWETPDDTDLVKDGAAAIRTLGSSIDTSMMDLKGGTTGQVLSKTSNTDMDFTWVTQDDANAIQNTIVDAKGDLISATAADTPSRLAVGTNGQILTADSTTATGLKWATAGSSALAFITSATFSSVSSVSFANNTFSSTYDFYLVHLSVTTTASCSPTARLRSSGSDDTNNSYYNGGRTINIASSASDTSAATTSFSLGQMNTNNTYMGQFTIGNPKRTVRTFFEYGIATIESGNSYFQVLNGTGGFAATTSFDSFSFIFGANVTGNYAVYGYSLAQE